MYYMFMGFNSDLPWAECDSDFAGDNCYTVSQDEDCETNQIFYQLKCMEPEEFCAVNGYLFTDQPGYCSPLLINVNNTEGGVSELEH